MVPLEAPYPDLHTDTFIFFLRSLCKIILINVHYFPNAPRIVGQSLQLSCLSYGIESVPQLLAVLG